MKYIYQFLLLVVMSVIVGGCLKKNAMNIDPDTAGSVVLLAATGNNQASSSSQYFRYYSDLGAIQAGDSAHFNINVSYSGGAVAPVDITVTLALDESALATYNTQDNVAYEIPPASAYRLPATVVIKKGTNLTQLKATVIRSSDFDFTKSYGLPIRITGASTGVVSANLNTSIYSFGVRNGFDGHYSMKGYSLRSGDGVKTGNFTYSKGMDLVTVGSNAVTFGDYQVWADLTAVGIGYPILTTAGDNTVTIFSSGGAYNLPGYTSVYDPTTKTFYVGFTWGAGPSSRVAVDTMVYVSER